jgi:molybdopterin synthase catalytic subunit
MRTWITVNPIIPAEVLGEVGSAADGATVLFLGTVRQQSQGRAVSGMRYEAYTEMAASVLSQIAQEAAVQAGTDRVAVVHRTGELDIGDVSVAIAVSSPHRGEAFDATRYIIEQIKIRLPVWKHEHYVSGHSRWVDGVPPAGEP